MTTDLLYKIADPDPPAELTRLRWKLGEEPLRQGRTALPDRNDVLRVGGGPRYAPSRWPLTSATMSQSRTEATPWAEQ